MYYIDFDTDFIPNKEADIIVIGSGIAGLFCAITLKNLKLEPVIITRGIGNTYYSQGGIAAVVSKEDSTAWHVLDTLRAGRNLGDVKNIEILAQEGPNRIVDLELYGVNFDKREDGSFETTIEGGHSYKRVLKVKDYTGKAIYEALFKKAKELNIRILEGELLEIITKDNALVGCIVEQNDELVFWKSRFLVLATGGAASMYSHTSNPLKTRADVIGIALRRGFLIENPEFVQFHPTVFENTNLLISEAVRGEGAILVNQNNERFVNELEPRDVVARAIYREMLKGNKVYLDMRNLKVDIKTRFPTIYNFLIEHGLDPYKDIVPITPAAHYYIGGIRTDENGETTVDGVYAIGEVASTRVHGANRLASNSLLEGVVFGYRAAYSIALSKRSFKLLKAKNQRSTAKDTDCQQYFETIKNTMWQYAGLERTEEGLLYAIKKIREIIKFCIEAKPTKKNKIIFDVSLSAYATLQGALKRRESRGCHFRSDFPYEKDEYRYNTKICLEDSLENLLD